MEEAVCQRIEGPNRYVKDALLGIGKNGVSARYHTGWDDVRGETVVTKQCVSRAEGSTQWALSASLEDFTVW